MYTLFPDTTLFRAMVNESINETVGEQARVVFRAQYQMLPSLQYTGTVSFDTRSTKNRKYLPQSVTGVIWTDNYFNRGSDMLSDELHLKDRKSTRLNSSH